MENETILNYDDLLVMLDHLLKDPKQFWENFYVDREKEIPFFKIKGPDENLVEYFENGLTPFRVLELGCGPGRNAIYMAQKGCQVDALDISENTIDWAKERANEYGVDINFHCQSLFQFSFKPNAYDFVYDCGLFHHLAPHRRLTYLEIIKKALKPNGYFGLVCFVACVFLINHRIFIATIAVEVFYMTFISPMLLDTREEAFDDNAFVFEPKVSLLTNMYIIKNTIPILLYHALLA